MIDPLPDARLRDDVAQQLFTQAMGRLEDMGNFDVANRRAVFGHAATISFEAAEAFVQARKAADLADSTPKIEAALDRLAQNGMLFTTAATASTAPTAPPSKLSLEKIQAMLDAVGPEPLGEWMREQGFPPEASLLILPETMRSQLPSFAWPRYVRFSLNVSAPTLMRDVLADHQVWERYRK